MKTSLIIIALHLAVTSKIMAQCEAPVQLPYFENVETAEIPFLPQCMNVDSQTILTYWFETLPGPIDGFEGNVFAFDSALFEFAQQPESTGVMTTLSTPNMELVQGTAYTVSFRYGNSDPQKTISMLAVELENTNITLGEVTNITGAAPADYLSAEFTPPATGIYKIRFRVYTISAQGLLYLDDIKVQETGLMNVTENNPESLLLYPNPTKDNLMLEYHDPIDSLKVYNSTGQLLLFDTPKKTKATINLDNLPSGIYSIHIESANKSKISRLIKE